MENDDLEFTPYRDIFPYKTFRPQQREMLDETFNVVAHGADERVLLISAPTGSGKSSNVIPAIKYAKANMMKVIIAISTKTQISIYINELESIIGLDKLDTHLVTNFSSMFNNCLSLPKAPDYDLSNATNISSFLNGCRKIEELPNYDLKKVTTANNAFANCYNLSKVPQSILNLPSCASCESMFNACSSLTSIGNIDAPIVTALNSMFYNCTNLQKVGEINAPECTSYKEMFYNCKFRYAPITEFYKGKDLTGIYNSCNSMIEIDHMNAPEATTLYNAFYSCRAIRKIGRINAPKCTDARGMFNACWYVVSIDLSGMVLSSLTQYSSIFSNCGRNARPDDGAYAQNIPYIYVRNEEDRTWLLNLSSSYRPTSWNTNNVIVAGSAQDLREK